MKYKLIGIVIALVAGLVACRSSAPQATPATPADTPQVAQTEAPTVTPSLPASPTPAAPRAILLALEGAGSQEVLAVQSALAELAAQDGLQFETHTQLDDLEFGPEVRLVVAVPPDPGLQNLAAANPQTQFLGVGIPGLPANGNLSVIGSGGARPDQQGFIAGNLASVITPDWRVGALTPAGVAEGRAAQLGFNNGVVFFCGLCRPAYPPFVQYPILAEIPAGAGPGEQQTVIDTLVANGVKTVYVYPGAGDPSVLESLAQAGMKIIGSVPAPSGLQNQWVASVQVDAASAVRQIWPRLLGGEQAISIDTPVVLTDLNPQNFSPGRQRLVETILADLLAGFIDTGVNPETGEPR